MDRAMALKDLNPYPTPLSIAIHYTQVGCKSNRTYVWQDMSSASPFLKLHEYTPSAESGFSLEPSITLPACQHVRMHASHARHCTGLASHSLHFVQLTK